jgi:hypothetical protein
MQSEDLEAGQTATAYTDLFIDAAVSKIDSVFGKGHAAANPALIVGYLAASATNLNSFMLAAASMGPEEVDFDALHEALAQLPPPPRGKRGR